ncbi:SWI/SNF related-matrix-associated actin-dependent regulator of chromatin subfamily C [Nematocida sp. AWRm77]|nr:SWI/SNF related-matrix-associated actin-dependent regulator of chromatin subfamily C [Nematocida sp. AWRm77]
MKDWEYTLEKVHTQSRMYKAGEVEKESVANISQASEEPRQNVSSIYKEYPHLFKVLEEKETRPVLVPLHSAWFSPDKLNEIEKRAFPHLDTEGGESRYMHTRNKMFRMFQESSDVYLTIDRCRKNISEDLSLLIQVHGFLEHWGLINYKIGVKRDLSAMLDKISQRDLYNVQKGSADTASVGKEERPHMVTVGESSIPAPSVHPSVGKCAADPLRDASKHFSMQSNSPRMTYIPAVIQCTECSREMNGVSGEDKIYFSDKEWIVLCRVCFDAGKYPPSFSYTNFYLLERGVIRQIWTLEEEMLLVEGVELYKDDWKAVAAYVKTKTVEQCVLHFLKMGIQDPLVEMEGVSYTENKLPFNYTLNPIMTTVAFLASVVHPGVASAAAKAATLEIQKISEEKKRAHDTAPWINDRLNEIAAVSLSSCTYRAQEQVLLEEGKKERLLELLVESEMKRIEAKVSEFVELSKTLKKEKEDLEKMRETYRKAHMDARREISEIVSKVKEICKETGRNFDDVFFKNTSQAQESPDPIEYPEQ